MPQLAQNKKARFDYEILETYEAGLVLSGQEVKSIRAGGAKLTGSFVTFHGEQARLTNASIGKYAYAGNAESYDPTQSRKLLLKKKELHYLRERTEEKGLTIIPLSLYTKGSKIKIEIAIVRGKKKYDKKEAIKKRDVQREMKRAMKQH